MGQAEGCLSGARVPARVGGRGSWWSWRGRWSPLVCAWGGDGLAAVLACYAGRRASIDARCPCIASSIDALLSVHVTLKQGDALPFRQRCKTDSQAATLLAWALGAHGSCRVPRITRQPSERAAGISEAL